VNTEPENTELDSVLTYYRPRLVAFIAKMTRNEGDVEDLVQETLIRVARGWDSFRSESTLSTWIFQIASNVCIDYFRAQSSRPELCQEENRVGVSPPEGTLSQAAKQEIGACVQGRIANLPEKYKRALIMYYLDGASIKEIAVAESISTDAAKVRLHRARIRFHDSCVDSCDVSSDDSGDIVCGPKDKNRQP